MRGEQRQRFELTLQCFLGEERVGVRMTWPTKPREAMLHFLPIKLTIVPLVFVSSFRN